MSFTAKRYSHKLRSQRISARGFGINGNQALLPDHSSERQEFLFREAKAVLLTGALFTKRKLVPQVPEFQLPEYLRQFSAVRHPDLQVLDFFI